MSYEWETLEKRLLFILARRVLTRARFICKFGLIIRDEGADIQGVVVRDVNQRVGRTHQRLIRRIPERAKALE